MQLSKFDVARILIVDYRYKTEKDRMVELLKSKGVTPSVYVTGNGQHLRRSLYHQVSCPPPPTWQDGWGAYDHFRAFKTMITEAKENGKTTLLIAEDDLIVTDDFDEVIERIRIPDDWDMIYYGANHTDSGTRQIAPNVLRCFGSKTTHLVAFRHTIYDAVLSLPSDRTIDWSIGQRLHKDFNCYAIFPPVALQKPNYSQLWKRYVDYTELFKNKGIQQRE